MAKEAFLKVMEAEKQAESIISNAKKEVIEEKNRRINEKRLELESKTLAFKESSRASVIKAKDSSAKEIEKANSKIKDECETLMKSLEKQKDKLADVIVSHIKDKR